MDPLYWIPVIGTGLAAGASCGLMGTFIVGMRVPFLGVCISHAALAGAVFGALLGLKNEQLFYSSVFVAILTAVVLASHGSWMTSVSPENALSFLFTASLGVSFLGLGFMEMRGMSDSSIRGLLWGSLIYCRWSDLWLSVISLIFLMAVTIVFNKELIAILFSEEDAKAMGIKSTLVYAIFLAATAFAMSANFKSVGGLMIYSLISNPALSAFQFTSGINKSAILSSIFGALSCGIGFIVAAIADLPVGPIIVITTSILVLLSFIHQKKSSLHK